MAISIYSKLPLSGSVNGKQILVSATTSGSAVSVHTSTSGTGSIDEVWLYAYNDATASVNLTLLWGGTVEPNDVFRNVIESKSGREVIIDGKLLQNSLTIKAYANIANAVVLDGFVNYISPDGLPSEIDPLVTQWVEALVVSSGSTAARPSENTKTAMSNFIKSLRTSGLFDKMLMVNCIAPDNQVAALTPVIGNNFRVWVNSGVTIGNLNVGLNGSGGSSFFNTQFNPWREFPNSASAGFSVYVSQITGAANTYDFGMTDGAGVNMFAFKANDTNVSRAFIWNGSGGAQGFTTTVNCPANGGYFSGNRTSTQREGLALYFANTTITHSLISSGSLGAGSSGSEGFISGLDVYGVFLGATRLLPGATSFGSTTNKYSFCACHLGLTETESSNLYQYVNTMRQSFGGGYF